jgi:hypothetical protein
VTGLFATVASGYRFVTAQLGRYRGLDASVGASGPHDFAVRNNISRQRAGNRSQAHHPPCDPIARKTLPRPPHPIPRP